MYESVRISTLYLIGFCCGAGQLDARHLREITTGGDNYLLEGSGFGLKKILQTAFSLFAALVLHLGDEI